MSTETDGGEPEGPLTTAPVNDDVTEFSLRPNAEGAASSATFTVVGVAGDAGDVEIKRRPVPVPRSACCRSVITCFSPAWLAVPFRMSLAEASAGVLMALPENM